MWKFDGFLFSGCFPKDYLEENIGPIAKPYRCLDPRSQDYYLLIARILANNPGIDISRVYIDAIVDPVVVESIIENIFQGKNRPYLPQNHEVMDYRGSLRKSTYDEYMQVYRMLWAQDRFDVFVTRWSNLEERLEAEHIPCILLRPSRETIMYYFSELLHDIRENAVQQSLVACCVIELRECDRNEENYGILGGVLADFSNARAQDLMIRRNDTHFEVITSGAQLKEITVDYSSCMLSNELNKRLSFPVYVGWGVGYDVVAAYKNARRALAECKKGRTRRTYLLTETQEMVGPLDGNRALYYDIQPDPHVCALAKTLGIAPINLEKMMSLQKRRNMDEITSSDLAYYLEITPRSASRILMKLSDMGFARPVRYTNLNGTGRPTTIYELDFSRI